MRAMSSMSLLLVLSGCVAQGTYDAVKAEREQCLAEASENNAVRQTALERARRAEAKVEQLTRLLENQKEELRTERFESACAAIGITQGQKLSATFRTGLGDIQCDLWPEIAPMTVENFVGLARGGREWTDPRTRETRTDPLYAGTVFHRVLPNFMIQGGDPMGTGRGGPGYRFADETDSDVLFDQPGLLAMANSGPNTNGSQFFITDSTPRHLDGKHTIFGKCEDLDVVRKIVEKGGGREMPRDPVRLDRIDNEVR